MQSDKWLNKRLLTRGLVTIILIAITSLILGSGLVLASATPPEIEWEKTFAGTNLEEADSVWQTTDGGYIIAGTTESFGAGSSDFYLVKTDAAGIMEWQKTFGGTSADYGYSVRQTTDGGYIIAGDTRSFGAGNGDSYLIKTDAAGIMEWDNTYGGSGIDYAYSVRQTTDGGYILEIGAIDDGGRAEAGYFNPNPVRVAWATVKSGGDAAVKIEVELRDQNYPGCLYKLTYLPEKDQLVGTYFQAQAHQTYNVEFVRAP